MFVTDERAVAPVIGFILLFAIGVIAFSGYQAVQVPQQNAETEFQHYQDVQNDLTVVRNAVSRAGQQNQSQFESVRLGTTYRERIFALNPPDPAGTLRTSEEHTITLDNGTTSTDITTRFLEYRNGYNELTAGPIYYENSVLYLEATNGNRVFFEDQNLVQENGNTVAITALQREFSRSATGRVTLELYPTDGGKPLPTGEVNVTLPTQLPDSYWRGQLAGEDPISEFSYNDRTGNVNQVLFNVMFENLEFNTVGINDEPEETGAVSNIDSGGGGGGGGGGGAAANQVQYVENSGSASREGPETRVDFDIENTGDSSVTITDIKIETKQGKLVSIRESRGGTGAGQHEMFIDSSTPGIYEASGNLYSGGDPGTNGYTLGTKQVLTQNGILSSFERVQVTLLEFRKNNGDTQSAAKKDFTVTLYFEDGSALPFSFTPPGY